MHIFSFFSYSNFISGNILKAMLENDPNDVLVQVSPRLISVFVIIFLSCSARALIIFELYVLSVLVCVLSVLVYALSVLVCALSVLCVFYLF